MTTSLDGLGGDWANSWSASLSLATSHNSYVLPFGSDATCLNTNCRGVMAGEIYAFSPACGLLQSNWEAGTCGQGREGMLNLT